jgi:hypothetical protein
MRHRFIALPLAALAAFVLASVTVAGGWAQVTAKNVPVDPPVGEETTIELDVLQHGVTPVSWPGLTVIATDAATGAVIRAEAQATGAEGSYIVKIVFPSAGDWTLTFDSAELEMTGSVAMLIAPPVGAAPGAGSTTDGSTTQAVDVLPQVLAVLALAAILAVGVLALRDRGARADSPVSAGT